MITTRQLGCILMVLFAAWVLIGCTTVKEIPVVVPAVVALPEKPVYEIDRIDLKTVSDEQVVKAYLISVEQCNSYASELELILRSVTRQPTNP